MDEKATHNRVKESLTALQGASRELKILDDRVRYLVREIERALAELGVGVRFSIRMDEPRELGDTYRALSYFKGARGWGLYIETQDAGDEEHSWSAMRLEECGRQLRAQAVEHHLVPLLESAAKTVAQIAKSRAATLASGIEVLDALNEMTGGDQ